MRHFLALAAAGLAVLAGEWLPPAQGYVLNRTIANTSDLRNAGVPACPMLNRFNISVAGSVDRRWDTTLGSNILTMPNSSGGPVAEVEAMIQESFGVWTQVVGSGLSPAALAPLNRTSGGNSCISSDGMNTICFAQTGGFSSGVLAFTQVTSADVVGQQDGGKTASFVGEILDADILFNPGISFATPGALAMNPSAFDLESLLIHELGHFLGFGHSPVLRAAMFPFAPPPGTFLGDRPTINAPDAPLADDDRAGLRVVYPGSQVFGTISGRILPANPLSLANLPATSPGLMVTGYYGTHVVALDADTGAVVAATLGGYSCDPATQVSNFDGSYLIGGLPLGKRYKLYAEPLDGPATPAELAGPLFADPCRQGTPNSCTVPPLNTNFTAKFRP